MEFCIFVNDHAVAGRREEMGQGKEVRASPGQAAGAKSSKFHISSLNKERKRNGCHFSQFSGLSRLSIVSVALASLDTTPVVWRPKEEIEVLDTDH